MATFPIGNIYAPPWMAFSPSVAGYEDIKFDIDLPSVSVPLSGTLLNQQLQLDADFDYLIREIQFVVFPTASFQPSDLRVRIRDSFGRLVTSDFVQAQYLCGVLPIIWVCKRGGVITFDFQNANASNAISVQSIFKGWKRKICPTQEQP